MDKSYVEGLMDNITVVETGNLTQTIKWFNKSYSQSANWIWKKD